MDNVLLRGTYIVGDIEAAIRFMKHLQHEIAPGPSKHRGKLAEGEPILVVKSSDPDAVYRRVLGTDAVIVSPPANWTVPGYERGTVIRLRSMSLFDPNGLYVEVNAVLPPEANA